jgi:hypothetical protein
MGEYHQQPARWCLWAWQFLVSSTTPSHVQPHLARIPALTGAVRGSPARRWQRPGPFTTPMVSVAGSCENCQPEAVPLFSLAGSKSLESSGWSCWSLELLPCAETLRGKVRKSLFSSTPLVFYS